MVKISKEKTRPEDIYKLLVEKNSDIIFHINHNGDFDYISPNVKKIIGISNKELLKKGVVSVIHPNDRESVMKDMEYSIKTKKEKVTIFRIVDKNGKIVWFEDRGKVLKDKNGKFKGIVGTLRDITHYKQTEEKLIESKNQFDALAQTTACITFVYNHEGKMLFINEKALEITGYKYKDLDEKRGGFLRAIHPDYQHIIKENMAARLMGKPVKESYEIKIITKKKQERWLRIYASRIMLNKMPAVLGNCFDITEKKNSDAALRESELLYKTLVETSPDPIVMIDMKGIIIMVNSAAVKLHEERSKKALIGKSGFSYIHPDSMDSIRESIKRLIDSQSHSSDIYKIITAKGNEVPVDLNSSILYDEHGKPKAIIGVFRDFTERYKAEQLLKESEEKFRGLAEKSPNMIFINKGGRIVYINPKCEEMMGYKVKEFYSNKFNFMNLIHDDYRDIIRKNYELHMKKNVEVMPVEYKIVTKNKEVIDSLISAKLINYQGEKAILGIVTDISAQKNIEKILLRDKDTFEKMVNEKTEELIEANAELEKTKRLSDIGTLSAIVAHELRNPLATIRMASYNIRNKSQDTSLNKHIANIEKKILDSEQIINNLLFYAKIKMPKYKNIVLKRIVEDSIAFAKLKYAAQKIKIIVKNNLPDKLRSSADPVQIGELVNNLISNACESFSDKKKNKKIEIILSYDNIDLIITIKDNGSGVKKDLQKKVFEPFYTRKVKGTGLGLTVCREIVDLHNGKIEFISQIHKGSMVIVSIPNKKVDKSPKLVVKNN